MDNPVRKVDIAPVTQADIVEPTIEELISRMEVAEAEPVRSSKCGRPMHRPGDEYNDLARGSARARKRELRPYSRPTIGRTVTRQ